MMVFFNCYIDSELLSMTSKSSLVKHCLPLYLFSLTTLAFSFFFFTLDSIRLQSHQPTHLFLRVSVCLQCPPQPQSPGVLLQIFFITLRNTFILYFFVSKKKKKTMQKEHTFLLTDILIHLEWKQWKWVHWIPKRNNNIHCTNKPKYSRIVYGIDYNFRKKVGIFYNFWDIHRICKCKQVILSIFRRWGQELCVHFVSSIVHNPTFYLPKALNKCLLYWETRLC